MIGAFVMRGSERWFSNLTQPTWKAPYTMGWWIDHFYLMPMIRRYEADMSRQVSTAIFPPVEPL